ncbi:MAG: hypothetical protein ACI350_08900 [Prevotella sp.]
MPKFIEAPLFMGKNPKTHYISPQTRITPAEMPGLLSASGQHVSMEDDDDITDNGSSGSADEGRAKEGGLQGNAWPGSLWD